MSLILYWALVYGGAGCLSVEGDKISAKDLARAVPEFNSLPETVSLGFAPLPGAHRSFSGADIQRIAGQYGIKTDYREAVCFEWTMRRLERSDVLAAMREAIGKDGVQLEEYSLFPAPAGRIVFPLSGLSRQNQGASFWRGYVEYGTAKKFGIWAKVKLDPKIAPESRVEVVGGSRVTVLVRSGAAELKFDAQAITSGAKGQSVNVRNPRSGRSFSAEVTGRDSVLVDAAAVQPGQQGGREK